MTDATVTWLHPPRPPALADTAALNDIHALLTSSGGNLPELLADVAAILASTGRPMVRGRDITASLTESAIGWPLARVDAEDTGVTVRQDPAGHGLLVEIGTRTPAESNGPTVTLDGRCLHGPCPPGGQAA